jgi:hypothetical protein
MGAEVPVAGLTIITNSLKGSVKLIRIVEFAKNLCSMRPITEGFTEIFSDLCISVRDEKGSPAFRRGNALLVQLH